MNNREIYKNSQMINVNGVTLEVFEAGQENKGNPVVLCHGWPQHAYAWRHQIDALVKEGYHVIVPNQRGYGKSSSPESVDLFDIEHLTGDLVGLLDHYGYEKSLFIGHDWGSTVVWGLTQLHPNRVDKIINLSVPYLDRGDKPWLELLEQFFGSDYYMVHFNKKPGVADTVLNNNTHQFLRNLYRKNEPMKEPEPGMMFINLALQSQANGEPIMTDEDLKVIQNTNVIVIGVGGLGGYIASSLVRLGVSNITIVDFDIFDESNLNRQMFATTKTIGKVKVDVVKQELLDINPNTNVVAINNKLDKDFDLSYFNNIDIAFDAVDNIESKLFLESLCTKFKIPLMHGAIGGFYGQFGIVMPGSNILSEIYKDRKKGLEEKLMSPTFTPAIAANLMIGEFVKLLIEKDALINEILFFNTLDHDYGTMYKK